MDLTTVDRVKSYANFESDTSQDVFLARLVTAVSAELEAHLRRPVEIDFFQEQRAHRKFQKTVVLRATPVEVLTSIRYGPNNRWAEITALDETLYVVDSATGVVTFLCDMPYEPGFLRLDYSGGMAADTDEFIELYPRIAEACDQQVAYHFQRRLYQGGNVTISGGGVTNEKPLGLLPSVTAALEPFVRRAS